MNRKGIKSANSNCTWSVHYSGYFKIATEFSLTINYPSRVGCETTRVDELSRLGRTRSKTKNRSLQPQDEETVINLSTVQLSDSETKTIITRTDLRPHPQTNQMVRNTGRCKRVCKTPTTTEKNSSSKKTKPISLIYLMKLSVFDARDHGLLPGEETRPLTLSSMQ